MRSLQQPCFLTCKINYSTVDEPMIHYSTFLPQLGKGLGFNVKFLKSLCLISQPLLLNAGGFTHPSTFYTLFFQHSESWGSGGACSSCHGVKAVDQRPQRARQPFTLTPMKNVEFAITCSHECFWTVGGSWTTWTPNRQRERMERTHTGRTCRLHSDFILHHIYEWAGTSFQLAEPLLATLPSFYCKCLNGSAQFDCLLHICIHFCA